MTKGLDPVAQGWQVPWLRAWNTDDLLKHCKSQEITIVMGDINAEVGVEKHTNIAGGKGIRSRNERGEQLIEWCEWCEQMIKSF